tara:strand:+ start:449 stop:814 length:366 start_codon:yes stop_codon:yes gene_type:complete
MVCFQVYGVNTGFGRLSTEVISKDKLGELQKNIIMSHSTGCGSTLSPNLTRRLMALRINTLLKGRSGISEETLTKLIDMFNSGIIPLVFEQGSVGASGDLVPLAHIGLCLIGGGKCITLPG